MSLFPPAHPLFLNLNHRRLCVRAILVHYPENGSLDPSLRFEPMFEWQLKGSAEMLSVSGDFISAYSYRYGDVVTPTLYIWNWVQRTLIATYPVPWMVTNSVCSNELAIQRAHCF